MRQLPNEVDLVDRPFVFVDGDLALEFNFKGVVLSDLKKLVLFGIPAFYADGEMVFFGEIADVLNQKRQSQGLCSDFLEATHVTVVDYFAASFHANVIPFLYEVVNMPKIFVVCGNERHVSLSPSFFDAPSFNSHRIVWSIRKL